MIQDRGCCGSKPEVALGVALSTVLPLEELVVPYLDPLELLVWALEAGGWEELAGKASKTMAGTDHMGKCLRPFPAGFSIHGREQQAGLQFVSLLYARLQAALPPQHPHEDAKQLPSVPCMCEGLRLLPLRLSRCFCCLLRAQPLE